MLALQHRLNLTTAMVVVLHIVAFEGGQTMTVLSARTGLSTSAVSHLLQRLVELGLIERHDDARDRRAKRVALSAAGSDLVKTITRQRLEELHSSVVLLTPATRARLQGALVDVIAELRSIVAPTSVRAPKPTLKPTKAAPKKAARKTLPKEST